MGRPPGEVYGGNAEAFDEATSLDELSDEFRDLLDSFVDGLSGPSVLDADGIAGVGFKVGDGPVEDEKWGETTTEYHVPEYRARELLEAAGFAADSASVNSLSPATTFASFCCRPSEKAP